MALSDYLDGLHAQEDRIDRRRSEKAKAFREYVDAKTSNGETVDPYELDRLRMSMAGGDPYLASYIPAGDALKEMANRANEQSRLKKLEINAGMAEQRGREREYVQRIIDQNWDKDEAQMAEIFASAFGQDGVRIYDQYKPELGGMLSEATNKQYATLSQNPAAKMVRSEDDLYRFFPAQMRNPKTAAILKSMAQDNQRQRSIDDVGNMSDVLKNTPDFVLRDPEMQKWWSDFAGGAVPGGQKFMERGLSGLSTQIQSEQQSKLIELASKDPYFAAASQTGDEDAIFAAIRSLMVQAGMPAPQSPLDPQYLMVQEDLSLISKTSSILTYNKREADLKGVAAEEAEAISKGAGKRVEALMSAEFPVARYGNGKSGKDAGIDDRIPMALNMIGTDPSFFPSEENVRSVIRSLKQEYDADKKNFDPAAFAGRFMSEGDIENKADWIDRRASSVLEAQHQIKPGTNFTVWSGQRQTVLRQTMLDAFEAMSQPMATQQEYDAILHNKAIVVQGLRSELSNIRSVINTLNNDPAKRSTISNYDYNSSINMMQTLENSLRVLESYNPVPPQLTPAEEVRGGEPRTRAQIMQDSQRIQTEAERLNNEAQEILNQSNQQSNIRSRFDTYLDSVADAESSGDPFARAKTSSATGLYQFTSGTWKAMVARYGDDYGITEQDIYNPAAQRIMASHLTIENANQLMRQTGREPNEKDLYLAHFLGPSRAATVINNRGSGLLAANMFPDAAAANRDIFYKDGVPVTIDELYNRLGNKIARRMKA